MEELSIENRLIAALNVKDQWEYCPDINTVEKMWDNLRDILNKNNVAQLNGIPLDDKEFEQIRNKLTFSSNFDAAKYLIGQNGIAHVDIKRDGKPVILDLFYRNQTFNKTVYQVVHQIQVPKRAGMDKDRRFDVTLLINGLPLIQIELKQQAVSENEAYEQIKKYEREGSYYGIFRFVELFVVSNASVTKYFAAGTFEDISKAHLTQWRDKGNNIITNLDDFTNLVLKRPMAYDMITRYTVLEEDKPTNTKRIITLRPYQIHAIESIEEASKRSLSGYVWHTTGSGKTLTSYKAARNLVNDIPTIKKTIFLVDRKDLDQQTSGAFLAYAANDVVDVKDTNATRDLRVKLYNEDKQLIVTTRQKLNYLIKELIREHENGIDKYYSTIKAKRIAFVVDECHRTIPPETMFEFRKFFQHCLWYGFTGTPIFQENKYENNGYALTTDELYGKLNGEGKQNCCLHKYTIENAINDGSVLGFNVTYVGSNDPETDNSEHWLSETHMLNVIKWIIQTPSIYGLTNGEGNTFESILTVPNIKIAQKYYELFKRVKTGEFRSQGIFVSKKIQETLPDFPKFAISYSVQDDNDNTDRLDYNKDKMAISIDDYNQMFETTCSVDKIDSYNRDLQNRLSRKGKNYENRAAQLDLVIVVNRLLTGFDAPALANLFVDRQPNKLHSILQWFSRTNRIAPKTGKDHGNIITFQSPELWQQKVKATISLFTNGGEKYALAEPFEEVKKKYLEKYEYLKAFKIKHGNIDSIETAPEEEQKEFIRNFQAYDKFLAQVKTYVEYVTQKSNEDAILETPEDQEDESKPDGEKKEDMKVYASEKLPELDINTRDDMAGHYNSLIDKFKKSKDPKIDIGLDLDYSLEVVDRDKINLEYIGHLMDEFKNNRSKKLEDDIAKYIARVQEYNPKLAEVLIDYFEKIKSHPEVYADRYSIDVIEQFKDEIIQKKCHEFADLYKLDYNILYFSASKYNHKVESPEDIDEIQNIVKNARIEGQLPFVTKKIVKSKIKEFFDSEILPLTSAE